MRPNNLVGSTSFRLAVLYAVLFGASVAVLFGVIFWTTDRHMRAQLDDVVETDLATLTEDFREGGSDALIEAITDHLDLSSNRGAFYFFGDAAGRRQAGNLPTAPSQEDWQELTLDDGAADSGESGHRVRGRAATLDGGAYLFVGRDIRPLNELHEAVARAFGWAGIVTVALALGGAAIMSSGLLRRLDGINRIAEHIIAGDLGRRIPTRASKDEFDRLATNLNAMLDQMESLMAGLRQVSNDIAHDLRTPLTRLRQTLETARRSGSDREASEAAIDHAIAETDGILITFGALLRIAEIESGARRSGFSTVDVAPIVDTVVEVYGPAAEEKQQSLTSHTVAPVMINADRELVTQMIANLVENAVRHAPCGAAIAIDLSIHPGRAILTVADNGPGIPAEMRERVFRRFVRLEAARTTPGNGLGLSLVAAIAGLHDIALEPLDNAPGLRMRLTIPLASPAPPG